jgi:hypothetical protein
MQKTWERGEFFHPSLSPFSYNETIANIYYPVDKSQASVLWYARQDKDYQINIPDNMERIETHLLPFSIEEVDDSILNKAIICEVSWRPFRLQKAELEFYRKHKLPIPRKHPDVRHEERMKIRPGRTLYLRTCDKCKKEILSVYPVIARPEGSPLGGRDEAIHNSQDMDRHAIARDDSQKVYCESCYQKEVYA